jgi:hypothetical protein
MSDTKIIQPFDYGSLTEDHKRAAYEISKMLSPELAEAIKIKFQIKDIPEYDISELNQKFKDKGIHYSIQGYALNSGKRHPIICVQLDCRDWEKFLDIKNKCI